MYTSRRRIKDYPYFGQFFDRKTPDYTVPLDQRRQEEVLIYESECDIQEVSKANNPLLIATFSVFLPWDVDKDIPILRGMSFKGSMNGIDVSGEITNVVLSQLGGLVVYVKDYDSD